MADHIDDVAAVSSLVRALLHERFTGEDDDPARRALLDRMASLRAATAHWASEFRRARDEGQSMERPENPKQRTIEFGS